MSAAASPTPEAFREAFASIEPLILSEWPQIDPTALAATAGAYDDVVELVTGATDQDRAQVERQLGELAEIAAEDDASPPAPSGSGRPVQDAMRSLQAKMNEVAGYVRKQMLDDAKTKARENFLVTLLLAIGLGFILGIIVRGFGRGRS